MPRIIRSAYFYLALSLAAITLSFCAPVAPVGAQIINPNPPIIAGTGLTKTGNTLSVNYGTSSTTALRGDTTSLSALTVSGATTSTGLLTASNALTVTTGATTLGSTLAVTGTSTMTGALTLNSGLKQNSSTTMSSNKGTLSATTSPQTLDSWATTAFFSGHYTVIVKQNTSYQVSDFVVVSDGTVAALTLINTTSTTGSAFATFSAAASAGTVTISVTYASGAQAGSFRYNVINTQA